MQSNKSISIIGLGGAGSRIIERVVGTLPSDANLICLDTDPVVKNQSSGVTTLWIGDQTTPRPFHALSRQWCGATALRDRNRIAQIVAGNGLIYAVACLGGIAGTTIPPVLLDICKQAGMVTIAVVSLPFPFEGRRRIASALDGLSAIEALADMTIIIPYPRLRGLLATGITLNGAIEFAADVMSIAVQGAVKLRHAFIASTVDTQLTTTKPNQATSNRMTMGFGRHPVLHEAIIAALACPMFSKETLQHARKVYACLTISKSTRESEIKRALGMIKSRTKSIEVISKVTIDDNPTEAVLFASIVSDDLFSS